MTAPASGQVSPPDFDTDTAGGCARFGFTVTKKLGNAVKRNRIRRRLKAAVGEVAAQLALPDHDYVVVARAAAFDRPFADMRADILKAFEILGQSAHKSSRNGKNRHRKGPA